MSGPNWGGGYVTDIDYMPGWYPYQAPLHLAITCLLMGIACDLPAGEEDLHHVELGCGLGLGAMTIAASNPSWRVTGIDYNPAHIAQARAVARDAGLRNIAFLEADLADFLETEDGRNLPEADFVTMHGVWSWVPPAVRTGIVRFLRAKVRAGGVVHVSYNSLPAWQSALGMQRVIRDASEGRAGGSRRRVVDGLQLLDSLHKAEAPQLSASGFNRRMMERFPTLPIQYLAHEYLNDSWSPCFHADVVDAFADAKLDWIGSASLTENFSRLSLTEAQQKVYESVDSPRMRELVKDMCLTRALRNDVFVRGAQRLSDQARDAALRALTLGPQIPLSGVTYEVELGNATASLGRDFYEPMLRRLSSAPRTVGELLSLPENAGRTSDPREVAGILTGVGYALPMLRPGHPPAPSAERFNRVAARWLMKPENMTKPLALASVAAGTGYPSTLVDMFLHDRIQAGEDASALESWLDMFGPGPAVEFRDELRKAMVTGLEERLPPMRVAGVF